jgi:hypothetical protein
MKKADVNKLLFILSAVVLFLLVVYKAANLSMTHDESASFYYLNHKNIIGFLFNNQVWPNANNHYLNTLSFQLTSSLFGPKEWAIRLFNQLSFLVYAWYGYRFSMLLNHQSSKVLLMALLFLNPFVLDFFSMARGYGVSVGFSLAAMFHAVIFLKNESNKQLIYISVALLIATLSLFSSLILYPSIFGPLLLFLLIKYHKNWQRKSFWQPIVIMGISTLIVFALTIIPLQALSGNAEFKWGVPTLSACFQSLISNSSYGKNYMPNALLLTGVLLSFWLATAYFFYLNFKSNGWSTKLHLFNFAFLSFLILIIGMIASKIILGTYYPVDRKTIMFIPFIGLLIAAVSDKFNSKEISIIKSLISIALILHFALAFQKDQVREWWYDRDTKDFFLQMVNDANGENFSIGCNWHFYPTLSFYSKTLNPEQTNVMPYSKEIDTKVDYDYYMCFSSDYPVLKDRYDVLHQNPEGRMILKLK